MTDGPQRMQGHRKPCHNDNCEINSSPRLWEVNWAAPGGVHPKPLLSHMYSRGLFVLHEKKPTNECSPSALCFCLFHAQFGWLQPPGHAVQWHWWGAPAAEAAPWLQWAAPHRGRCQEVPFPAGVRQTPLFPQFQFQFQVCPLAPLELAGSLLFFMSTFVSKMWLLDGVFTHPQECTGGLW